MKSLRSLFLDHVGQTSPEPLALEIIDAEGVKLYDKNGKDYIDLIAGVSVANLGHKNPSIIKAVKSQTEKYLHLMVYGEFIEEPQVKLAEKLASLLPSVLNSTYFVNSGSEAIEGAMKLAKRYTGRTEIISAKNAYHGSTHGAMSLMSDPKYTAAYRPLLPSIKHIEFNNENELKKITEKTACVIVEVIQGEAGIFPAKQAYLENLRETCQRKGALLIFDEIQTGFGRSGHLFAFQKYNVIPDILVLAKALGAGLPLGAFISDRKIMNTLSSNPVLGHITTFGGHPLSCAAALAGIEDLLNKKFMEKIAEKEQLFYENLHHIKLHVQIRSAGLLMAVDVGKSKHLFGLLPYLYNAGIHTDWFLFNDHSYRISPPLSITNEEVVEACDRINFSVKNYVKNG